MSQKLRFAVIGAGGFAETCHIPGLQSHPKAEIVAVCSILANLAKIKESAFHSTSGPFPK